ncbi:MAG: DUF2273 domain-containing protein [Dethiobacteria bacterium]
MQEEIAAFLEAHKGKLLGGLAGLIIAFLIIQFGFWRSLFILFCIAIGIYIGWRFEDGGSLTGLADRFWPNRKRLR